MSFEVLIGAAVALLAVAWGVWLTHTRERRAELFIELLPELLREETVKDFDEMDMSKVRRAALVAYTVGGALRYRADLLWDYAYMYEHPMDSSHDERYPMMARGTARGRRAHVQVELHRVASTMHSILYFQVQPWWWRLRHGPTEARRRWKRRRSERSFRQERANWVRV